jgi:hypothetical protein
MKLATKTLLTCTAATALLAGSAQAGTLTASPFITESDLVVTGGAVHVAVIFGDGGDGQSASIDRVVNGITHNGYSDFGPLSANGTQTFSGVDVTTAGFNSIGDFRNQNSRYPVADEPVLNELFQGIIPASGVSTIAVSDLTIGEEYLLQVYWEHAGASVSYDFTVEGVQTTGLTQAVSDPQVGTLLSTTFVAGDDELNMAFDYEQSTNHWISGFSLQVVPEPSSLALMGLGGLLIARRRRNA